MNQRIYNQLVNNECLRIIGISIVWSNRTIVITNLPLHITRYFTKIVLNYNPINNKIHLRTDSADEDIANTFDIIGNDKKFTNTTEVVASCNKSNAIEKCVIHGL
jgi:hypothetical protein